MPPCDMQLVTDEFGEDADTVRAVPSGVTYKWASEELAHTHDGGAPDLHMDSMMAGRTMTINEGDMSIRQEQVQLLSPKKNHFSRQ